MNKDMQYGPKSEEHKNRFAASKQTKAENMKVGDKPQNIVKNEPRAR